ncbi:MULTISPECIES: tail fiber assembly protein [unclassified Providencia]|uniref:tail fiber assembly protein n=1 Tax=unclassified Providencia TaxID=2633465 RepID=UPI002349C2E3|nr:MULTISPECIES: tail fiber assembly protein [unclassified Providencia]WOB99263.1 tail fiber assembly protein [Providencia sp. PROV046]
MKYFKNTNGDVYAYDDTQLFQVSRLTELERLIPENESAYIEIEANLNDALIELENAKKQFDIAIESGEEAEVIDVLTTTVSDSEKKYGQTLISFNEISLEYHALKTEYDDTPKAIFEIRENINSMKKMSAKEVEAHLNPPISKEQLIEEAEQKKQSLLMEVNSAIAPLQDAVELDMAMDEEKAQLKAWKTYRVYLNRVDTSLAPDIDWPEKP